MSKSLFLAAIIIGFAVTAASSGEPTVVRGEAAVRDIGTPLALTTSAYDSIWRRWGSTDHPADFRAAVHERYGLHFEAQSEYPHGIKEGPGLFTKSLSQNCLLCHAGTVAGQTIVGLGNATLDYQGLVEDLSAANGLAWLLPFQVSRARGTIEASAATTYLLQFRNHDLTFREEPADFLIRDELYEDIPAWWNMKHKQTMFHGGSTDVRSIRVGLAFPLSPVHGSEFIKKHEGMSSDIKQFLYSLEAPKYPFPVDEQLAVQGERIFRRDCARCHGSGYDQERLGMKFSELDCAPSNDVAAHERRKVTDTTKPGRGNQGHRFGDKLGEEDRHALLQYLKTL